MNTGLDAKVRLATVDDALTLARLRYEFRAALKSAVESEAVFVERCADDMRRRLSVSSPWRAWVLERHTRIVGTIWLQVVDKLPNPGAEPEVHGYITNFYVCPEFRSAGIGSRLLRAALTACRELSVDTVFLWPTERSRSLYERHGFRVRGDLMSRPAEAPQAAARPTPGPGGGSNESQANAEAS